MCVGVGSSADEPWRKEVARAIVEESPATQAEIIRSLIPMANPALAELLAQWREGAIVIHTADDSTRTALAWADAADANGKRSALRIDALAPFTDAAGVMLRLDSSSVEMAETTSPIRRAMKEISDLSGLGDPDLKKRLRAIRDIGLQQAADKIAVLETRREVETHRSARRALDESLAFIRVKHGSPEERVAACRDLATYKALFALDGLRAVRDTSLEAGEDGLAKAASTALNTIESHLRVVNAGGTVFRGLSLGSILLVASIGLAITFGLMGVINMAHGEMMAVGAYTTYLVQSVFAAGITLSPFGLFTIRLPGMGATGLWFDAYFIVAIP
jgi:urea transport system permease protein